MVSDNNKFKRVNLYLTGILFFLLMFLIIKLSSLFKLWFIILLFVIVILIIGAIYIVSNQAVEKHKYTVISGITLMIVSALVVFINLNGSTLDFTCSMHHHDLEFDEWWARHGESYMSYNISKSDFIEFPMKNGIGKIQGLFLDYSLEDIKVGDIIAYEAKGYDFTVAHRVVSINISRGNMSYVLISDNGQDVSSIQQSQIKGIYRHNPALDIISRDLCKDRSFEIYCRDKEHQKDEDELPQLSVCCFQNDSSGCIYDFAYYSKDIDVCKYITSYWRRLLCEARLK